MITIPITVEGETRDVEVERWYFSGQRGETGEVFGGRIGRGTKVHPVRAHVFGLAEEQALRLGYRKDTTYRKASDGRWYAIQLRDTVLNRPCRVVAWLDQVPDTALSRHIME